MSDLDALKATFREDPKLSKRELRAARTRAHALSPMRILTKVLLLPVVIAGLTVSIYVRTSPYERTDAMRHLVAMAGCDTAQSVGLAPAFEGQIGYHKRNDPDGDGVACGSATMPTLQALRDLPIAPEIAALPVQSTDAPERRAGGAKFLKP